MEIIFICTPKNFPTPSNPSGFNVEGLSCSIADQTSIGQDPIVFNFRFYVKDNNGDFVLKDGATSSIHKNTHISAEVAYPIPSMLMSNDKTVIYQAAQILAAAYGYNLLSYEQQTYLASA